MNLLAFPTRENMPPADFLLAYISCHPLGEPRESVVELSASSDKKSRLNIELSRLTPRPILSDRTFGVSSVES